MLGAPGGPESVVEVAEQQQHWAGQTQYQQGQDGGGGGAGESLAAGEGQPGEGGQEGGQAQQVEDGLVLAAAQPRVHFHPGQGLADDEEEGEESPQNFSGDFLSRPELGAAGREEREVRGPGGAGGRQRGQRSLRTSLLFLLIIVVVLAQKFSVISLSYLGHAGAFSQRVVLTGGLDNVLIGRSQHSCQV